MSKDQTKEQRIEQEVKKRSNAFVEKMEAALDDTVKKLLAPLIKDGQWEAKHSAIYSALRAAFLAGVNMGVKNTISEMDDLKLFSDMVEKRLFKSYTKAVFVCIGSLILNAVFVWFYAPDIVESIRKIFSA